MAKFITPNDQKNNRLLQQASSNSDIIASTPLRGRSAARPPVPEKKLVRRAGWVGTEYTRVQHLTRDTLKLGINRETSTGRRLELVTYYGVSVLESEYSGDEFHLVT